ncbi:MAG: hypothetical protein R3F54_21730 [Alphaproteobacteria bacterium]
MAARMTQPHAGAALARTLDRCRRYVSVWRWLLARTAKAEPKLLAASIICGIGGRLGTLIGFALAVKCAAFILKPELIPTIVEPHLPEDHRLLILLLATIPGLAFVGGAIAQILYNSSILRLRNAMAERLSLQAAEIRIAGLSAKELSKGKPVAKIAGEMRLGHAKLVSIEVMLVNLIVLGSVVLLAFITGMMINGFLMSVVTSVGVTFSVATAAFRHLQSRDTTKRQKAVQATEKSTIKALADLVDADAEPDRNRRAVGRGLLDLAGIMSDVRSVNQRFNNTSALILDLGQAVIIVTFLILLTGSDGTAMPMLIILVLIFRFFVSYLQAITHTIIKLGPNYPFLVDLWLTLAKRDAAENGVALGQGQPEIAIDAEETPSSA